MGGEKKKFQEGGIGQGEKFFLSTDHIFLKFHGGGICMGNYKKNSGGDVDREIKNISGKYEY